MSFFKTLLLSTTLIMNVAIAESAQVSKENFYPVNHKLIYETPTCKIFDVLIPAGASEQPYSFNHHNFLFIDHPAKISIHHVNEKGSYECIHKDSKTPEKHIRAHVEWHKPYDTKNLRFVTNNDKKDYKGFRVELEQFSPSLYQNYVWLNHHQVTPEIEYCVWNLSVGSLAHVYTTNHEAILVGRPGSQIIVKKAENVGFKEVSELHQPVIADKERATIWHLEANCIYILINPSTETSDPVYALPIPL